MKRTALVTGGNRGIGLEICRGLGRAGLAVLLGSRDPKLGEAAAAELRREKLDVRGEVVDVSKAESIEGLAGRLEASKISVDVLVNNAAVYPPGTTLSMTEEAIAEAVGTNFLGPLRLCRTFIPGMVKRRYGRIVNLSSGYGSFAEGLGGPSAYCLTKAAINALTLQLSTELPAFVKVNSGCPGWVKTRMGGDEAPLTAVEGADTMVWLATLPDDGPTGGFYRERRLIPW